jgi:hypothetical protein
MPRAAKGAMPPVIQTAGIERKGWMVEVDARLGSRLLT